MIGLPKTTEFNKRIPKQKFYENMTISPAIKRVFVEQVKTIYWKNKIAVSTTNLAEGNKVTELEVFEKYKREHHPARKVFQAIRIEVNHELEVFEIHLNNPELDEKLLYQIDKVVPYHILFLLEYQGEYQAWVGFKEKAASGNKAFKVNRYYHTEWMKEEELPLHLEGLSMDAAYENYVRQIAGDKLQIKTNGESLKESVTRDEQRQLLQKKIDILKAQIRKEKQLNKQMQINRELKILKKELEEYL